MSEEIKKDKFWLVAVMNGTLVIVEENGEPKKFGMKDAYKAAADLAKEYGAGYVGVVFEALHMEIPELTTKRVAFMSSSKIEAGTDE